jgi:hypothetical protein
MEKLRDEILQCESTRADLLKWKLAIAGGIGAAGLGFAGSVDLRHADLVLCVVPLVAVYVDLLCRHLTLKMLVIGTFLTQPEPASGLAEVFAAYEAHAAQARELDVDEQSSAAGGVDKLLDWLETRFVGRRRGEPGAFDLEDWALSLSTVALSLALLGYGIGYGIVLRSWFSVAFVASGAAGLLASAIGNQQYVRRFKAVERLESKP